ncbi:MAG: outer-membrane lipoprotein carrier protein LolA [candidate division WOR-3 bacterium]|nr:outer-membrane lipoprotein carrier protein LolA [candidate division WOR-3 bacterium]MCX7757044.1 outer-membrane lipoprotein carrier protein LolA [candidate division WOR-3 bacterium]MDW7987256.1 outer-membrane lipoprotein carrier protein LolA [candidate division WOR-3 bacterium]
MKKFGLLLIICATANFLSGDALLDTIKQNYKRIFSLQGKFNQTICSEVSGTCQELSGKFYIMRPYYTRLEVDFPKKQLIVADSLNLYIYLIEQKKVYQQKTVMNYNFFKLFDTFLNMPQNLKSTEKKAGFIYYMLLSDSLNLDSDIPFKSYSLGVNQKSRLIEEFSFVDLSGNEFSFKFQALKVNEKIPKKLFSFKIPKGVEVINLK